MAAMDFFVRNNMPSIRSQTQASISIPGNFKENTDVHWSWSNIKEEFRIKEAEGPFHKYQARMQHSLLVLMTILNLMQSLSSFIVYFVVAKNLQAVSVSLVMRSVSLIIYITFLCVSHRELWFRPGPSRIIVSITLLISMTITTHGSLVYRIIETGHCERGVRPTYYVILLIFVMLPFPRKWHCAVASLVYTALEIFFLFKCEDNHLTHPLMPYMFASEAIFYLVGGLVGLGIRFLMEVMNRRAFLDRRACLEAKRKLDIDRSQQEKLLLSVIPNHIMEKVKYNLRQVIVSVEGTSLKRRRTFNQLFIETHLDVSILYADIVNSVNLAASLTAFELVKTLDQLFASFDTSAEQTNCFRVKLLGDCYYCVSGMPEPNEKHADNCVKMGLAMIDIIRSVREEFDVDVDMRIGVHSGRVMSGLLGLWKWQYDIWSKDVLIASRMEQTGRPGHVHLTDSTYKKLRKTYYPLIRGEAHLMDSFLQGEHVEATYFIRRPTTSTPLSQPRRNSMYEVTEIVNGSPAIATSNGSITHRYRTTQFVHGLGSDVPNAFSLRQYRQLVKDINDDTVKEIDRMALSKRDQWCNPQDINPLFLTFKDSSLELEYRNQPDPLFKYYMLCALFIFCGTTLIHILAIPWNTYLLISFAAVFLVITFGNACLWIGYLFSHSQMTSNLRRYSLRLGNFLDSLINASRKITLNWPLRLTFWFLTSGLLLSVAMLGLDDCEDDYDSSDSNSTSLDENNGTSSTPFAPSLGGDRRLSCQDPWYFTFSAILAMTSTSVFLRIHYWLKLAVHTAGATIFCYVIAHLESAVFHIGNRHFVDWRLFKDPLLSHCYFVMSFALTLHLLDRQIEYMCRVNYLSERRLRKEEEEENIQAQVNRALLINILPIHVARKYLEDSSANADHLYYEEYRNVAVMFASMPEYTNFYTENMINEQGRKCLQLLNEIFCDFDELFWMPNFRKVTKIKTIGSTYMAATGLLPDRNSVESEGHCVEDASSIALTMVEFAEAMLEKLQQMNKETQQDQRLRIGIAIGPLIAGVVGSVKPQYDIWGDTVNTASRMESTGVVGKIQVTQEVADLLEEADTENHFKVKCRGQRMIKGKGKLTTYIVKTPFDGSHQETSRL